MPLKIKNFRFFSLYTSQISIVFWGKKLGKVVSCRLSKYTGTSAEHCNCYGSKKTGMAKLLSRTASCSKCGMARYQHIIKSLANTHSLTAQSRIVSLRPSVLDSLASFPWGYIQTSLAKWGDSLYTIMKPRSGKRVLPRSHWWLPRIHTTKYWKQDRPLSAFHVTSFWRRLMNIWWNQWNLFSL